MHFRDAAARRGVACVAFFARTPPHGRLPGVLPAACFVIRLPRHVAAFAAETGRSHAVDLPPRSR
jgi:hypothetical protein